MNAAEDSGSVDLLPLPAHTTPPPPPSRSRPPLTFDQKMQVVDLVVKGMGALVVIIAGWISVAKYLEDSRTNAEAVQRQKEADLEQRKKEFKIKFYEQQFALYTAICDVAARVATAERLEDVEDDLRVFHSLYWGKLCIVESQAVEKVQRKIHDEILKTWQSDTKKIPTQVMTCLAYELAHACRDDLEEVFRPEIGKLPGRTGSPSLTRQPLNIPVGAKGTKIKGLK